VNESTSLKEDEDGRLEVSEKKEISFFSLFLLLE
jgi:hypothetical protein